MSQGIMSHGIMSLGVTYDGILCQGILCQGILSQETPGTLRTHPVSSLSAILLSNLSSVLETVCVLNVPGVSS